MRRLSSAEKHRNHDVLFHTTFFGEMRMEKSRRNAGILPTCGAAGRRFREWKRETEGDTHQPGASHKDPTKKIICDATCLLFTFLGVIGGRVKGKNQNGFWSSYLHSRTDQNGSKRKSRIKIKQKISFCMFRFQRSSKWIRVKAVKNHQNWLWKTTKMDFDLHVWI